MKGRVKEMLECQVHEATRPDQFDDVDFFLEFGASQLHRILLSLLGAADQFARQKTAEAELFDAFRLRRHQRDRFRCEQL